MHGSFGAVNNSGGVLNIGRGSFEVDAPSCGNGHTTTYYAVYNAGNNAEVSATISGGSFVSQNTYVICNGNSTDGNLMKKSSIVISDGEFTIYDNSSNLTAIFIDSGVETTSEITGGKFSAPLPDNATIPPGMTEGVDADDNTIVGEPITITVTVNGETIATFTTVSGGTLKDDLDEVVPTETAGYDLRFEVYNTRDNLINATFTETTTIKITKSLDVPLVNITGDLNPSYGETTTLTAECTPEATTEIWYTYQWYKDGREIPGETDKMLVISESGDYTVTVTARDGDLTSAEVTPEAVTVTVGEPNVYTITFLVDGEYYASTTVQHGKNLENYPTNPEKEGYIFDNWYYGDTPAYDLGSITQDYELSAQFIEIESDVINMDGTPYIGNSVVLSVNGEVNYWFYTATEDFSITEPIFQQTIAVTDTGYYWVVFTDSSDNNHIARTYVEFSSLVNPPITDDDDDYVPIVPVVPDQSSGDDNTVTIVACAAAAVVAALMAVFLIIERRK